MGIKVFLAGIMQGSRREPALYSQDYRQKIKSILKGINNLKIYCPYEHHPQSLNYDQATLKQVFLEHIRKAAEADVIIAYLPEASMGTAIEIWEASQAGKVVLTISPLTENWVIKALATRNFLNLDEFEKFIRQGGLKELIHSS